MKGKVSLGEEIGAELQYSLPRYAAEISARVALIRQTGVKLRGSGFLRTFTKKPIDDHTCVGIATHARCLSYPGGLLCGLAAAAKCVRFENGLATTQWEDNSFEIFHEDFFEWRQRLAWKRMLMVYAVLDRILEESPVDLLLTDMPLVVSRRLQANTHLLQPMEEEWNHLVASADNFWKKGQSTIFPFSPRGPQVVMFQEQSDLSPFLALWSNAEKYRREISVEGAELILKEKENVQRLGYNRTLHLLLAPLSRTIAVAAGDLGLDPRWEPTLLKTAGLTCYCMRANARNQVWQLELPGDRSQWKEPAIDALSNRLAAMTLILNRSGVPYPIWLARQTARFPKEVMLYALRRLRMATPEGVLFDA